MVKEYLTPTGLPLALAFHEVMIRFIRKEDAFIYLIIT